MSWAAADVMSWAAADVMKPGFERVRTHSKPGFMTSRLARGAQIAVLAVPVLPEPGSRVPYPSGGPPAGPGASLLILDYLKCYVSL